MGPRVGRARARSVHTLRPIECWNERKRGAVGPIGSPIACFEWPYVELSPGLVWSRWRVGSYGDYRGTSVQPGFTTGFGFHGKVVGKVAMEVGFRFLFSTDTKRSRAPGVTETMEGLRQTAILAGLSYAL